MLTEFNNDDQAYLDWLATHSRGYVINTERGYSPHYMVLHRATCTWISQLKPLAKAGGFTERGYVKICADTVGELSDWVAQHGNPSGAFSSRCPTCGP